MIKRRAKNFISVFISNLSLTSWIILFNVLFLMGVWILSLIFGEDFLVRNIAFSWDNLVQGRVWTLLTSIFMHGSFAHLFFNMFSLFFIGRFIEKVIGRKRYFIFYLIAGVFASFFFGLLAFLFGKGIWISIFASPSMPAVGASGAIFGLLGLLALIVPKGRVYLILGPLIALVLELVLQNFLSDNIMTVFNFLLTIYFFVAVFALFSFNPKVRRLALAVEMPFWLLPIIAIVPLLIIGFFVELPIGNTAHIGGLLVGIAYGLYLRTKYKNKVNMLNRMVSGGR